MIAWSNNSPISANPGKILMWTKSTDTSHPLVVSFHELGGFLNPWKGCWHISRLFSPLIFCPASSSPCDLPGLSALSSLLRESRVSTPSPHTIACLETLPRQDDGRVLIYYPTGSLSSTAWHQCLANDHSIYWVYFLFVSGRKANLIPYYATLTEQVLLGWNAIAPC